MIKFFCILFLVLGFSLDCVASACCARSSAAPTLILGDNHAQFGIGAGFVSKVASADAGGAAIFEGPESSNLLENYRLDGSILLSDRWQIGLSLSVVRNHVKYGDWDSSTGLGDTRISAAYEAFPLWTYSPWRPQGFLFGVLTLPTGRSTYEDRTNGLAADVVGNGFFSLTVGSVLLKRWGDWDAFLMPEVHYSVPRTFSVSGNPFQVSPGFGTSLGIGGGLSPGGGNLRVGVRVQPRYDQGSSDRMVGFVSRSVSYAGQANCDVGFDMAYLFGDDDSLMLSYTDQTLLGPAMNSPLNRVFGVNFQHRWER